MRRCAAATASANTRASSRTISLACVAKSSSTGRASVGVMAEGEYTFGTAEAEEMTVVSGALNVLLPGETEWKVYAAGEAFNVPGHSEFHLQVAEPTSYLCRYLK